MSAGTRVPLAQAETIAAELVALLDHACEQVIVCGSVRRRRPTIGDLDILAVPTLLPVLDMFDLQTGTVDALNAALNELAGRQVVRLWRDVNNRPCWGPKLKRFSFRGLDVQVQAVDPDCLGVWVIVRTGPAHYSRRFVTQADKGGKILPPGYQISDGFRLLRAHLFVATPTEEDVYRELGLPYVAPEDRGATAVVGVRG